MREEILINVTPQETRVAVVENGVLQEVHIERGVSRGLVGNIYKGVVKRVMPGMQAAFIDLGLEKAAFLHVAEILPPRNNGEIDKDAPVPEITELLREGQSLVVQVIKDQIGSKGARLTTHLTIPSRYLVLMPTNQHIGVSQRIASEEERNRLREIVDTDTDGASRGFIIRTAAEGAEESALHRDAEFLKKLWAGIQADMEQVTAPGVIHEDLSLVLRTLRDVIEADVEKIRVDSRTTCHQILSFCDKFLPTMRERVEAYQGERPIFDLYNIEEEIERALERKVALKSGGYLIMDQTEAMTTIDVNTGAFVGHKTLEETIFKTNLEAASAVARQLRLRNLGGIIIVDFIDMLEDEHKRQVLRTLEKSLAQDHVKTQISEVSALGLVEMTRKRQRESLEHLLCEPCGICNGRGFIKTPVTVCYEIFREINRAARAYEAQKFLVLASQDVVDCLLDEEASNLAELEAFVERPVRLQAESLYSQDQFDVVLM